MCAAGNLMITSKSIFTFSLSFFGWWVSLSPAQRIWQRSFPVFGSRKEGKRDWLLFLCWETNISHHLRDFKSHLFIWWDGKYWNVIAWKIHWNVNVCDTHKYCVDCGFCYFPSWSYRCNGVCAGVLSLNKMPSCFSLYSELLYSLVFSSVISKKML